MLRPAYRALEGFGAVGAVPRRPLARHLARATAPILGRGPLFERRLARCLAHLEDDPAARSMRPEAAEHYFGDRLVFWVDPARLGWQLMDAVTDGARSLRLAHRFLDAGDWTGALEDLPSSVVRLEVDAIFDEQRPLRETEIHRYMRARAEAGEPERRNGVHLSSEVQIDAYFAHYRALRDSIRDHGFLARGSLPRELRHGGRLRGGAAAEREEREVGVAVDANGRMLRLLGGRHRTAIAQRLGVRRMPVQLRLVHVAWLRARMEETGLPAHRAILAGIAGLACDRPGWKDPGSESPAQTKLVPHRPDTARPMRD